MSSRPTGRYAGFPPGFFDRQDATVDSVFYTPHRLVTHIDSGAIAAVGSLYNELGLCGPESGPVLDIMSSWVSHFPEKPAHLTVLGMNGFELDYNTAGDARVVHDLNTDPSLPFDDASFRAVVCCVSVDYLTRPLEVFDEVARVLRPDGVFVCTFSNRCFPSKAIRGWLSTDDRGHCAIVAEYFRRGARWSPPIVELRTVPGARTDPLYAVWVTRTGDPYG